MKRVSPETLTVDLLPALHGIDEADLCDTGLKRADGSAVKLFSSQNPRIVATHFRWMKDHDIDVGAMQRFVSELKNPMQKRRQDHVLANARAAAEAHGRSFYIAYDVSGADPKTVVDTIRSDWRYIVDDSKLTASRAYLRDGGKPVLQLWGFGFADQPGEPGEVWTLLDDLKRGRNGLAPATLVGGVPTYWRTLERDSKPEHEWADVYRAFDVLSPWTVGRFGDTDGAKAFIANVVKPDLAETRRLGLRYLPVVFPGFSWHNLMTNRGKGESAPLNRIARHCGRFMWRQVSALINAGVDMLYVAMFDEADEGTAIFPVEALSKRLPDGARMVHLGYDGCALPDDWYLRLAARSASYLHARKRPPERLEEVVRPGAVLVR